MDSGNPTGDQEVVLPSVAQIQKALFALGLRLASQPDDPNLDGTVVAPLLKLVEVYDEAAYATSALAAVHAALDDATRRRLSELTRVSLPMLWTATPDDLGPNNRLTWRYVRRRLIPRAEDLPLAPIDDVVAVRTLARDLSSPKNYPLVLRDLTREVGGHIQFNELGKELREALAEQLILCVAKRLEPKPTPPSIPPTHVVRAELEAELAAAIESEALLIWVTGEVGAGKSYMARHVLDQLQVTYFQVRCFSRQIFEDDLARLVAAVTLSNVPAHSAIVRDEAVNLLINRKVDGVIVFDGLDDFDVVDDFFTRSWDFLTPVLVTSRLGFPHFSSREFWTPPIAVFDLPPSQAGDLARKYLVGDHDPTSETSLGTILSGRAQAIIMACSQINALGLDVDLYCDGIDAARVEHLDQTAYSESWPLIEVYRQALALLADSPLAQQAFLLLDVLAETLVPRLRGEAVASIVCHLYEPDLERRIEQYTLDVDAGAFKSQCELFAQRGARVHELSPSNKLQQRTYIAVTSAISLLIDMGLVTKNPDDSISISHFTATLLRDLRADHLRPIRRLIINTALAELAMQPSFPGYSYSRVLMALAPLVGGCIDSTPGLHTAESSEARLLLESLCIRAERQLLERIPRQAQITMNYAGISTTSFGAIPKDDVVWSWMIERMLADYARLATRQESHDAHRQLIRNGCIPAQLRGMIARQVSGLDQPSSLRDELALTISLASEVVRDVFIDDLAEMTPTEILVNASAVHFGGRAAAALGRFMDAGELLERACAMYRVAGGLPSALSGEVEALGDAITTALRGGRHDDAARLVASAGEVTGWMDDVLSVEHSALVPNDEAGFDVLSDALAEYSLYLVIDEIREGERTVTPDEMIELIRLTSEKCAMFTSLGEDGRSFDHRERAARTMGLTVPYVYKNLRGTDATEVSARVFAAMAESFPQHAGLDGIQISDFGRRQILLAGMVSFALTICAQPTASPWPADIDAAPVENLLNLIPEQLSSISQHLEQHDTVGDFLRCTGVWPSVQNVLHLAQRFKRIDQSQYWYVKGLCVATCLQQTGIDNSVAPKWLRGTAVRLAVKMGRTDWVEQIGRAPSLTDGGLLYFCAL